MPEGAGVHKLREQAKGTGDIVLDRWGVNALPPKAQRVVRSRPKAMKTIPLPEDKPAVEELPPWWWNPGNPAAATLPASVSFERFQQVRSLLQGVCKDLDITWNGKRKVWQVWYYKPGFMKDAPWANGWIHLKDFKPYQGTSHIVETIKHMDSMRHGSAKERHRRMQKEKKARKQACRMKRRDEIRERAGAVYDHMRISVGYGQSRGDKFASFQG